MLVVEQRVWYSPKRGANLRRREFVVYFARTDSDRKDASPTGESRLSFQERGFLMRIPLSNLIVWQNVSVILEAVVFVIVW